MLSNFRLRTAISLGYACPVVLMFILGGVAYSGVNQTLEAFKRVRISQKIIIGTDNMTIASAKISRALRGHIISKKDVFIKEYQESWQLFQDEAANLEKILETPAQQDRLRKMVKLGEQLNDSTIKIISLIQQNKTSEAVAAFNQGIGQQAVSELDRLNQDFNDTEQKALEAKNSQAEKSLNSLMLTLVVMIILTIAIATSFATFITSGVAKKLNSAANIIASSSTEIAATAEQQERMVSQQSIAVNQTTATMKELSASAQQSAEQATTLALGAEQVLVRSKQGNKTVEITLEGISDLKQKVEAIAEQIHHLNTQTSQIGSISSVVSDLANQTNMLALNAAVEAVRAGEYGRGFNVVAKEIRILADQSKKSADKINTLVTDIQTAISSTVNVTAQGTSTATKGLAIVKESAAAFNDVIQSINNISISIQQISLTAKQQASAVEQVFDAMNTLNVNASETASGVTQLRVGIQAMNKATLDLKTIV